MATVRMSEAELARNIHDVLAQVRQGLEVVIGHDRRPVAVIKPSLRSGRPISDIVQEARRRNSTVTLDPEFRADLEAIIESHLQPWNSPSWE